MVPLPYVYVKLQEGRIVDPEVSVYKGLHSVGDDTMNAGSTHLCPQDWPSPDACSVLKNW